MAFDVESARKSGYTDAEIAAHLSQRLGFDLAAAKRSGYTEGEVIAHLLPKTTALAGSAAIPGAEGEPARAAAARAAPAPSMVDQAIGVGEAGLSLLTGATGGMVGMVGGTVKGMAQQLLNGQFGTPQAANAVEQAAAAGAQALTYAPRTEMGQERTADVGGVLQNLLPLAGLQPQVAGLMQSAGPAASLARGGAAAVMDTAATSAPALLRRAAPAPMAAAEAGTMSAEALAQTARTAGEGGMGSRRAERVLATEAAPDPAIVASAERLGVAEYLQPDHVTTSEAFRQVNAAIKSNPQSALALAERENLTRVAERAATLVDEIGGTRDLSELDTKVKARLQGTQAELDARAEALYNKLREGIPARAATEAPNVLAFIRKRAGDLGGEENLSGMERMILRKLSPKEGGEASAADVPGAVQRVETLAEFVKKSRVRDERMSPEVRGNFVAWLRDRGGIDFSHKYDITGETSGVLSNPAGVFKRGGRGPDDLASMAAAEGYLRPDQAGDTAAFIDLVKQAVNGDRVLNFEQQMRAAGRAAQDDARQARLSAVERRLQALGVDTRPAAGNAAALEAYAAKYEATLLRDAVEAQRARGSSSDMPQWEEMKARARQVAEDVQESGRSLAEFEAENGGLSTVMRKMVRDELRAAGVQVADDAAPAAATTGTGPTYALLDDVRRDLTAAKYKRQGPFKDADTGLIKKLEMELMKDQKAAIEPYGMLDTFEAAQNAVRVRKGIENDLSALFGKALDGSMVGGGGLGLGGATAAVARGDASKLLGLLKRIPEDMRQEVVASGLSTVFRKAATRGELDFTGYVKWYEGLKRNRQAYSAVMSNLPLGAAKQLEALYRVSAGVSESLNRRVKTGALNTIKAEMMGGDGLMENLYSAAKRSGVGVAAEAVTTPMGIPGAGMSAALASALTKGKPKTLVAVDALIASPEFAQLVRTQAGTKEQAAAVKAVARSPQMTRFIAAVGKPAELSDRERWILQAMQSSTAPMQQQQDRRQGATIH